MKPIYIKCRLCDLTHHYEYSDSEFNAIEVDWKSPNQHNHLLEAAPIVGKNYLISLHSPLTLKTNSPFWAVYLNPNSHMFEWN